MQSPINIDTTNLYYDKSLKPFTLTDYSKAITFNLKNDGETSNLNI